MESEGFIYAIKKRLVQKLIVVEKLENEFLIRVRRSICEGCPDNVDGDCGICKCILEIKTATKTNRTKKGTIEWTHCPVGKWGDSETANFYKN